CGYGTSRFHLLLIWHQPHRDFFVQLLNHLFDGAHVAEALTNQKAVMIGRAMTFQRFDDLRNLYWRPVLRLKFLHSSIRDIVGMAYRMKPNQIVGPDWIGRQRYKIAANLPDGASQGQV